MKNFETEAAWKYHNGTKHPNGSLLDRFHNYNLTMRPSPYKKYICSSQIKLLLDKPSSKFSALEAISTNTVQGNEDTIPDMRFLSKILYFSGGITKTIRFPDPLGSVEFRAASCTGALFHIEIYLVCSNISGLEAGVYHFDPKGNFLTTLRKGDYRKVLAEATGNEPSISRSPLTLVYTDIFSRNSVKYQAREYRHAFWDCGTILANSIAIASANRTPYKILLGFVDSEINELLGLDGKKEAALALLPLGKSEQEIPELPPLGVAPSQEPVECQMDHDAILEMHESSSLQTAEDVSKWREWIIVNEKKKQRNASQDKIFGTSDNLEQTIIRRGSTRKFSHDPIPLDILQTILSKSTNGFVADFGDGTILNDIYLIVNAVDSINPGAYFYNKLYDALEILRGGNLRDVSGHLGLDQSLPYDASVTIFFLVDLEKILKRFGNRGYRAAQMDASITAGRMYLAAYALGIGATGLTFYDDEITEFFSPHAEGKSVMFMLAIGKKAPR